MQGPYDADVPLQVVCYFKHKAAGDTTLGAAVELDAKLGGVIASLRNRGEFAGDELETLLLSPPEGTIKPKGLLLIGLGDEESLSLERMERVGRVALREASRLGAKRVAFAPLDPGPGQLEVRHGRGGECGRPGGAPRLRHREPPPEGGAGEGSHDRGVDVRGRAEILR